MDPYRITFETYNKIASLYQEKFMGLDLYDDTYDRFCELVPSPARIFEIGCGPGNITRYLSAKRPDCTIDAIDVAPNMIALARINVPSAHFSVMDCRKMDSITKRYEAIMCGFCLPYLAQPDCEKLFGNAAAILHAKGLMYLSTIEGDYSRSGFEAGSSGDKAYVYYHSEAFLLHTLQQSGFQVVDVFRKAYPKGNEPSTHLVIIAQKA